MIAGMTYYQIAWFFLVYSFGGWTLEVAYQAVKRGQVINRGFLNGPVCPVYGFGMLAVLAAANISASAGAFQVADSSSGIIGLLVLFAGGVFLATAVELIAGWLLDICFHTRWWDYSREKFNFRGYICLKFSLIWGLIITVIVRLFQPVMITKTSITAPSEFGWVMAGIFYALYLADLAVTLFVLIGLNRKLTELDEIRSDMRIISNDLSSFVGTHTIETSQKIQEQQVQAALGRMEFRDAVENKKAEFLGAAADSKAEFDKRIAELEARRAESSKRAAELMQSLTSGAFGPVRLFKAFPDMVNREHGDTVSDILNKIFGES